MMHTDTFGSQCGVFPLTPLYSPDASSFSRQGETLEPMAKRSASVSGNTQHTAIVTCTFGTMAAARAPPVTLLHLNTTADCLWTPSAGAPHQPYDMQECATLLQQSPRKSVCNLCMVTLCIHLACACTVATARVRKRFDTHTHTRNITARRRTQTPHVHPPSRQNLKPQQLYGVLRS